NAFRRLGSPLFEVQAPADFPHNLALAFTHYLNREVRGLANILLSSMERGDVDYLALVVRDLNFLCQLSAFCPHTAAWRSAAAISIPFRTKRARPRSSGSLKRTEQKS